MLACTLACVLACLAGNALENESQLPIHPLLACLHCSHPWSRRVIGDKAAAAEHGNESILMTSRSQAKKLIKRKRQAKGDPADLEGYLGAVPYGKLAD